MKHDLSDPHDAARFALTEGLGWADYLAHAVERGWGRQFAYGVWRQEWDAARRGRRPEHVQTGKPKR